MSDGQKEVPVTSIGAGVGPGKAGRIGTAPPFLEGTLQTWFVGAVGGRTQGKHWVRVSQ